MHIEKGITMHDAIQTFQLEGQIDDGNIPQTKERLIDRLEGMMRDEGFAPVLDIIPHFTLDFNDDKFNFKLTLYGAKVDNAWQVSGIMDGKVIPRYIPLVKSAQS